MKLAYLRVSTDEQRPDRQIDGLQNCCDALYIEKLSATSKTRPVYERVMRKLKRGDTFVVWDLDRAFRSTVDALLELEKLHAREIEFEIVSFRINTATDEGVLAYTIIAAFAQFERNKLITRTKEGMEAAKRRGRHIGRPYKLSARQIRQAHARIAAGRSTITATATGLGCTRDTLARACKRLGLML